MQIATSQEHYLAIQDANEFHPIAGEQGIEPSGAANDLRPQSVTSITGRSRPNTRDVATPGTPGAATAGGAHPPTRS